MPGMQERGEWSLSGGEPVTKTLRTRETILAELAGMPVEFERLVLRQADRDDLMRPAPDGGWGVVEILPHLRDWEEIYFDRAVAIVTTDLPRLQAFDDSLWEIERDYRGQDPEDSLAQFAELRERLVAYLTDLPHDAWQREGDHSAYGRITLQWMADHICDHDREHLQQALDAVVS
jgi:hypothetical protein